MLKVNDVIIYIESIAPIESALSYDNVGLMLGKRVNAVTGILCCLDLTDNVIDEAINGGFNTIITHHPPIFNAIKKLDEDNVRGMLLCKAIRNNLNVYSAHTNWDFAEGGVNDTLCKTLMLENIKADSSKEHRFGDLNKVMSNFEFVDFVKEKLNSNGIKYIIPEKCVEMKIKRVGVSSGSFDEMTSWIYENEIDALVTGELKHSYAIDLNMHGFITISAGHYETELLGMRAMSDILSKKFDIEVKFSDLQKNPFDF